MAFSLFGSTSSSVIAIDIGSSEIKLAEVSRTKKGFSLGAWVVESLQDGAVEEGMIEKMDAVVSAVSRAMVKSKTKVKVCVMGLPSSSLLMKKVRLPEGLSTEDMEVSVETELAGVVPFDLSEASVDWVKIDSEPNEDGEEYLLVAVRTDKVDERVFLAEQLGLELVGVDGACFAVETLASVLRPKAVGPGGRRKVDLIVDIGHRRSRVYVAADGVHVYEREIQQGCQSLTILISQMLSCAMADAEVKKVKGKVSKAEMDPIYESFNVQMLQEISRAVQLFYSSTQFNWVDTLWLAGRGASTPGLLECLRDRGGFNVSLLDASSVFSSSEVSGLEGLAPSFFLAFGLAFNFLLVQK